MPRRLKREARIAYLEIVGREPLSIITIVFRGCWMDGMLLLRSFESLEGLEHWLEGSTYFKELNGIALGDRLAGRISPGGQEELGRWIEGCDKAILKLVPRNQRQAKVIVEGLSEFLGEKG